MPRVVRTPGYWGGVAIHAKTEAVTWATIPGTWPSGSQASLVLLWTQQFATISVAKIRGASSATRMILDTTYGVGEIRVLD